MSASARSSSVRRVSATRSSWRTTRTIASSRSSPSTVSTSSTASRVRFDNRGYVLMPFATLEIEGFRQSNEAVAAFRFAAVGESYAAQMGAARNVGVIGVALLRRARRHDRRRARASPPRHRQPVPGRPALRPAAAPLSVGLVSGDEKAARSRSRGAASQRSRLASVTSGPSNRARAKSARWHHGAARSRGASRQGAGSAEARTRRGRMTQKTTAATRSATPRRRRWKGPIVFHAPRGAPGRRARSEACS